MGSGPCPSQTQPATVHLGRAPTPPRPRQARRACVCPCGLMLQVCVAPGSSQPPSSEPQLLSWSRQQCLSSFLVSVRVSSFSFSMVEVCNFALFVFKIAWVYVFSVDFYFGFISFCFEAQSCCFPSGTLDLVSLWRDF